MIVLPGVLFKFRYIPTSDATWPPLKPIYIHYIDIRLCSIFGLWITYSTIYPGFKMATIFWICCVKTVRHPNDPPKKLLFNLAVTKLLAVKIVGKCQIAPLNSIFWVFKMKFLKKKIFFEKFWKYFLKKIFNIIWYTGKVILLCKIIW